MNKEQLQEASKTLADRLTRMMLRGYREGEVFASSIQFIECLTSYVYDPEDMRFYSDSAPKPPKPLTKPQLNRKSRRKGFVTVWSRGEDKQLMLTILSNHRTTTMGVNTLAKQYGVCNRLVKGVISHTEQLDWVDDKDFQDKCLGLVLGNKYGARLDSYCTKNGFNVLAVKIAVYEKRAEDYINAK